MRCYKYGHLWLMLRPTLFFSPIWIKLHVFYHNIFMFQLHNYHNVICIAYIIFHDRVRTALRATVLENDECKCRSRSKSKIFKIATPTYVYFDKTVHITTSENHVNVGPVSIWDVKEPLRTTSTLAVTILSDSCVSPRLGCLELITWELRTENTEGAILSKPRQTGE